MNNCECSPNQCGLAANLQNQVDALGTKLLEANRCVKLHRDNYLTLAAASDKLIEERDRFREALEKIEPMLITYADATPKDVEFFAEEKDDWVCQVIMVARRALHSVRQAQAASISQEEK